MLQEKWRAWTPVERVIVTLVFGILMPLQTSFNAAEIARERAAQDVILIETSISDLRAQARASTGITTDIDRFRVDVTRLAQARGLSVVRLQNGAEGSVQLIFAHTPPAALFAWLDDISGLPGSRVIGANLLGRDEGIEAEIELQGAKL